MLPSTKASTPRTRKISLPAPYHQRDKNLFTLLYWAFQKTPKIPNQEHGATEDHSALSFNI